MLGSPTVRRRLAPAFPDHSTGLVWPHFVRDTGGSGGESRPSTTRRADVLRALPVTVAGASPPAAACELNGVDVAVCTVDSTRFDPSTPGLAATLDTTAGRVRGPIVMDVISAGFRGTLRCAVCGMLTQRSGQRRWDLELTARARGSTGARATFGIEGVLDLGRSSACVGRARRSA